MLGVLEEARRRGFLGPGPVEVHLGHAAGFAAAVTRAWESPADQSLGRAADLGSGAGVPGLPLALLLPATRWLLVESSARRAAFLREAVRTLDLGHRVVVVEARAEDVGRRHSDRGRYDLVVARGFGPPAVVAECGAPLLGVGGQLVVSEPPGGDPGRWPAKGLALLGLATGPLVTTEGPAYQVLVQTGPCPSRFPRRVGVPGKRPLF